MPQGDYFLKKKRSFECMLFFFNYWEKLKKKLILFLNKIKKNSKESYGKTISL